MSTEWCQMQRRMNTCEQIITGLFSLDAVSSEVELIKEKLRQLEEWTVHIPDNQPELIEEWNRKLVNWWKGYSAALYQQRQQPQSKQCHCILSEQSSYENSSNLSLDNKPTSEPIPNLPTKSSQSDSSVNSQVDVQPSRQTILSQMEHAFAQLDPVPECSNVPEYLDLLTQLATLVTKVNQRSLAHALKDNIFEYAFAKLSSKLQLSYKQEYGLPSKSLISLAKLLAKQIRDYIQQEDENRKLINIDGIFCHYCKKSGHLKDNCPERLSKVCFKCFKMGHIQKECTD